MRHLATMRHLSADGNQRIKEAKDGKVRPPSSVGLLLKIWAKDSPDPKYLVRLPLNEAQKRENSLTGDRRLRVGPGGIREDYHNHLLRPFRASSTRGRSDGEGSKLSRVANRRLGKGH